MTPIHSTNVPKLGFVLADYWYVQQGFRELAQYFGNRDAHIPSRSDPRGRFVTPDELFAALQHVPRPAQDVATALLAEPRDIYQGLRELQVEGLINDGQVSVRDLAAAAGPPTPGAAPAPAVATVYQRVQRQLELQRRIGEGREVSRIADPVWRELAASIDRAGNRDGWLAVDANGFIDEDEMAAAVRAVAMHERIPNLRPRDLFDGVSPRHQAAADAIAAYRQAARREAPGATPLQRIPIDLLTSPTVRAYAREIVGEATTFPLSYDNRGRPSGALAVLVRAVTARDGGMPEGDAWITDRHRLAREAAGVEPVLQALPPAELFDFTSHGVFASTFARDGALTRENVRDSARPRLINQVDVLHDGTVRRMRESGVQVYRARFPANMERLGAAMRAAGLESVPVAHLVALANGIYRRHQEQGTIGNVYDAHMMLGTEARDGFRPLTLSPAQQQRLESFFAAPAPSLAELTAVEREAVTTGRLTREEVGELRALRAATQVFEQSTVLGGDYGGWSGNVLSEVFPEVFTGAWLPQSVRNFNANQTNCLQEANTYALFMQQLEARGLLRHFVSSGIIRKATRQLDTERSTWVPESMRTTWDTVHAGVLLTRRSTGDNYVLDSWVDGGGTPAHIVRVHEWLAGNYQASTVAPPRPTTASRPR